MNAPQVPATTNHEDDRNVNSQQPCVHRDDLNSTNALGVGCPCN